ncbi:MAG: winged helix-turn-helix domain-containing protein, partial [Planctomycetota bacterium]
MAYSFLELAEEVLKLAPSPLTYQQCWHEGQAKGLTAKVKTKGKTPWQTMGAR